MHRQAHEVLPALLTALDIDATHDRPWLFGHSDGASMTLLYAGDENAEVREIAGESIASLPRVQ